jgi:hypothetical protein
VLAQTEGVFASAGDTFISNTSVVQGGGPGRESPFFILPVVEDQNTSSEARPGVAITPNTNPPKHRTDERVPRLHCNRKPRSSHSGVDHGKVDRVRRSVCGGIGEHDRHHCFTHDARGDVCRALLQKTLRFDLTPLRDVYRSSYNTTSGEIILLGNWPDGLSYRF